MPAKKKKNVKEAPPVEVPAAEPDTPESLLKTMALSNGTTLESVFNTTGIPVLQHKFRKALMGSAGSKPRVLTLSEDCTRLTMIKKEKVSDLRACPDDEDEYSQNVAQVGLIHDGAASPELAASLKKREKSTDKVALAAGRCFTIAWRGERGAWDLELELGTLVGGKKLTPDTAAELKDCLVGFLNKVAAMNMGKHDAPGSGAAAAASFAHAPKPSSLPTAKKRQLSITGTPGDAAAAAAGAAAAADEGEGEGDGGVGAQGVRQRLQEKAFGFNYICRERAEGEESDEEVDLATDATMPYPASIGGGFSCHGIEPKFSKTGFEVARKVNQDRGCMVYPFCDRDDMAFFCAMDGHGKGGELISDFAIKSLPGLLAAALDGKGTNNIPKALKKAFLDCDAGIRKTLTKEAMYAGTTVVACLVVGKEIYTANCGDSRAVICGVDPQNADQVIAKDLSIDHKPDLPEERARILKCGGWVSDESAEDGPARVWLDKKANSIGLAMARSFGDHVLGQVGVFAEPEVTTHTVTPYDKYLIVGSDGIFEFVTSQAAAQCAHDAMRVDLPNAGGPGAAGEAVKKMLDMSNVAWKQNEGDYRDDITGIVVRMPCFPANVPGTQFTYPAAYPAHMTTALH